MPVFNLNKARAAALAYNLKVDPDLVALWMMNEQSGIIIERCTKNRLNSASVNGAPTYSATLGDFWGLSDAAVWLGFGNQASLAFERTDAFSVLAIISPDAANGVIIGQYHTSATPRGWMFFQGNDAAGNRRGQVDLEFQNANRIYVYTDVDYAVSTAVMVGFSYSGSGAASGVIFYRNGAVDASSVLADTLGANSIVSTAPANIGAFDNGTYIWNGKIGPIAVFNAAKTAADFKRWAGLGGFL